MIKKIFNNEDGGVGFLASVNLGIAGIAKTMDNIEPVLHFLLVSGQIAVAAVTVIYIWKKTKAVGKNKSKHESQPGPGEKG